jgi:hypothetical protein
MRQLRELKIPCGLFMLRQGVEALKCVLALFNDAAARTAILH